ncbi:MAG: hypothetical protein ACI4OA_05345, partial [Selenomonadaceae bacterium]
CDGESAFLMSQVNFVVIFFICSSVDCSAIAFHLCSGGFFVIVLLINRPVGGFFANTFRFAVICADFIKIMLYIFD